MKVIAANRLLEAQTRFPSAHSHLQGWYEIIEKTDFSSPEDLKKVFGDINGFNSSFKFPIPESRLLAHTLINFSAKVILIKEVTPRNQ